MKILTGNAEVEVLYERVHRLLALWKIDARVYPKLKAYNEKS